MSSLDLFPVDIQRLCVEHKVKTLYAFGSVLTQSFNSESDIDLVVDFENMNSNEYADNYFGLKFALQGVFQRSVDLLEEKAIKNPYFKQSLEAQKKLIYAK
jgi:uncharacterized protein